MHVTSFFHIQTKTLVCISPTKYLCSGHCYPAVTHTKQWPIWKDRRCMIWPSRLCTDDNHCTNYTPSFKISEPLTSLRRSFVISLAISKIFSKWYDKKFASITYNYFRPHLTLVSAVTSVLTSIMTSVICHLTEHVKPSPFFLSKHRLSSRLHCDHTTVRIWIRWTTRCGPLCKSKFTRQRWVKRKSCVNASRLSGTNLISVLSTEQSRCGIIVYKLVWRWKVVTLSTHCRQPVAMLTFKCLHHPALTV